MHDFRDDYEMDEEGRLRKKRVMMPDGATMHFPHIADHAAYGFSPTFADGSADHTNPHGPGHRFADVNDADRLAADQAYAERSKRMENSWRNKDRREPVRAAAPPPAPTLDQLQAQAQQAWEQRNERMAHQQGGMSNDDKNEGC